MRSHFSIPFALALLAAAPAVAGPSWQFGLGFQSIDDKKATYSSPGVSLEIKRKNDKAALSLFAGYEVWDFGTSGLAVTGEYQFKATNDIELLSGGLTSRADYKRSTFAPGVQWTYHTVVNLGAGLQYRLTRLELARPNSNSVSDNNNRFWLTGTADYPFQTRGPVKPFVGIRLAVALSKTDTPNELSFVPGANNNIQLQDDSAKQLIKGMDARAEFAVQAGVRF